MLDWLYFAYVLGLFVDGSDPHILNPVHDFGLSLSSPEAA